MSSYLTKTNFEFSKVDKALRALGFDLVRPSIEKDNVVLLYRNAKVPDVYVSFSGDLDSQIEIYPSAQVGAAIPGQLIRKLGLTPKKETLPKLGSRYGPSAMMEAMTTYPTGDRLEYNGPLPMRRRKASSPKNKRRP